MSNGLNHDVGLFTEHGYVVVPDVIDREQVAELYAALDELQGGVLVAGGTITKFNERALLRDPQFLDVVLAPKLLTAARASVGDDLQLLAFDALETAPGSGARRSWHADFTFFSEPLVTANSAIYLQDMTVETGPLLVIPGSHRWKRAPTEAEEHAEHPDEVAVTVSAGTAVLFDSQLWHSGGRNESDRPRRALFPYWGHYWVKRMDDFYRTPLPDEILHSDDALVRQLFGLALAEGAPSPHGGYDEITYG